jgi:iron complex outermembrane recepter protein
LIKRLLAAVGLIALMPGQAGILSAQTGSVSTDSLRHYELSEVIVGSRTGDGRIVEVGAVRRVALASIVRADAASVAGLARLVPSAHVQTNSRGESLIYLRNSGERQVAVFLDGALLNVPWDNRVDLSAIPSSILGGIKVTQGAASVLFGPNVPGGVVSLASRSLDRDGALTEFTAVGGSGRSSRVEGMYIDRKGESTFLFAGGFNRSSGLTVAGNAELPFGQSGSKLRTNTDRRTAHGFARWSHSGERTQVGVSLLHVAAAKGIAAEGHLDPSVDRVRYWRYPDWRMSMLSVSLVSSLRDELTIRGSGWGTLFAQGIDQFVSQSYERVGESQKDRDRTGGLRLVAERRLGSVIWRTAINGLVSSHRQRDASLQGGSLEETLASRYRQTTWSLGSEFESRLAPMSVAILGVNLDRMSTPATADKPARGPTTAWGATATLNTHVRDGWELHATIGRKVRFPTMRELFGTALRRFLINEALRPESAWLADAGMTREWGSGRLEITAFLNRTKRTIDQTNVDVGGETFRQRVNLDGSRVLGLEFLGFVRPAAGLRVDFAATVTDPRVTGDPDRDVLTEKPDMLANIAVTYQPGPGSLLSVESVYTGLAFGLRQDNTLERLPRVLQFHLRGSVRHYTAGGLFGELFVRLNNLTDRAVVPQLGLPGPGRTVQLGLSVAV